MIEKHYDTTNNILFVKHSHIITLKDILESLSDIHKMENLPTNLTVLQDNTNSKLELDVKHIDLIISKMNSLLINHPIIKHAIVTDKPFNTVVGMLAINKIDPEKYKLKVFSTKDAAMDWLRTVS